MLNNFRELSYEGLSYNLGNLPVWALRILYISQRERQRVMSILAFYRQGDMKGGVVGNGRKIKRGKNDDNI